MSVGFKEICSVEMGSLYWINMVGNPFRVNGRIGFGVSLTNGAFRFTYDGYLVRFDADGKDVGHDINGWFPVLLSDGTMKTAKGLSDNVAGRKLLLFFPAGDCWIKSIQLTVEIKLDDSNTVVEDTGKAFMKSIKKAVDDKRQKTTMQPLDLAASNTF